MIRSIFLGLIRLYQYLISPMMPPACRFYPSCSAYTYDSIKFHGVTKGLSLGIRRILRCHPFNPGGYDPVLQPETSDHKKSNGELLNG
jgi:uncharacterized protein